MSKHGLSHLSTVFISFFIYALVGEKKFCLVLLSEAINQNSFFFSKGQLRKRLCQPVTSLTNLKSYVLKGPRLMLLCIYISPLRGTSTLESKTSI